ncbi:hypothetical protein [Lutibacter sp.]|uniref:hypothetical protein n=1 Tax=Lutibacter sp. TaxID=1925666 RepID=UPI00349FFF3E
MRAKKITLLLIILLSSTIVFSQVGIGTVTPNTSAILDVDVTSLAANGKKGFLPPRMTTTERDAIVSPATGLLIYNSTTNILNYYTGSGWTVIDTSTGSFVDLSTPQTVGGDKTFTGTLTPAGRLMLPMGEISWINYSGAVTNIVSQAIGAAGNDNMVKINPSGTAFINDVFGTGTDTRLTYTGTARRLFHIALSFSFQPMSNGDTFIFGVAKNGTVLESSKMFNKASQTTDSQSSAIHVLAWLDTNEFIEFWVGNLSGTSGINMKSFNFVAIGM